MLKSFITVFLLIVLLSCTKDGLQSNNGDLSSYSRVFDTFWKQMNSRYSFWDIDIVDWDRVYHRYKPLFDSLDIRLESDNKKAFQYFSEMTTPLMDGHFSITFTNPFLSGLVVYPSYQKKQQAGYSSVNYLAKDTLYLDKDYYYGSDIGNIINGRAMYALCGTISDDIIYFSCNYFQLYDYYTSSQGNSIRPVLHRFFDLMRLPNIKGMIIDVRNNPGGDIKDLNFLVGHLTSAKHPFGFARYKIGNDPLAFTPWMESFINPVAGAVDFKGPKIVLTDRYSASLSELAVMAIRSLPNASIIGDTTWGATAFMADPALYNAGSFDIKNVMKVSMSSGAFKYINDTLYEDRGFPPDVYVPYDPTSFNSGKDVALEKAIEAIE